MTGDAPTPAEPREQTDMEALRASIEAARKAKSRELPNDAVPPSDPLPPVTLDVGDVQPPRTEPRHLWLQELVRASYAFVLVLILAGTVYGAFAGAQGANWANVKDLLQLLLPAETALLGSAAGFYFGSRRVALCANAVERRYLQRRLAEVS